jgi:hypothetical protein
MKNIIIYTTNDEVVSLHLVNKIVSLDRYKDYNIDIFLSKPNFIRKLKVLLVIIFFGSITELLKNIKNRITIKEILNNNKNCKVIKFINKEYDLGLSVYCSVKIQLQKFKIYNFHLGSLEYQRGSFIFFYKFLKNWDRITLTFHEITKRYDVGKIFNEKEILLKKNCHATDILFVYLKNFEFLNESLKKLETPNIKEYKNFEKLNLVPNFINLIFNSIRFFIKKIFT